MQKIITIIGAGASGISFLKNLIEILHQQSSISELAIMLIEKNNQNMGGIAYTTPHLCNRSK